jgi:hypothetical protein
LGTRVPESQLGASATYEPQGGSPRVKTTLCSISESQNSGLLKTTEIK